MVPVDMDQHQKIYLWFRLLKWTDTKNQFSKKTPTLREKDTFEMRPHEQQRRADRASPSLCLALQSILRHARGRVSE
jgi:hypothetical protein